MAKWGYKKSLNRGNIPVQNRIYYYGNGVWNTPPGVEVIKSPYYDGDWELTYRNRKWFLWTEENKEFPHV